MSDISAGAERFISGLGQIVTFTPEEWQTARAVRALPRPLVFLHEASHWFGQRLRVRSAMSLLLVRELDGWDPPRKSRKILDKIIALRELLAPFDEGLALYCQHDYFPANFFDMFGPRSHFDEIVEMAVSGQMWFAPRDDSKTASLAEQAHWLFVAERLSEDTFARKLQLLQTPWRLGEGYCDDHLVGYILFKQIAANVRLAHPFYVHDGLLVPFLAEFIHNAPELVLALLNPRLTGARFVEEAARIIGTRLAMWWNRRTIVAMGLHAHQVRREFDYEASMRTTAALDRVAQERMEALRHRGYEEQCWLSVEDYLEQDENLEHYVTRLEGYDRDDDERRFLPEPLDRASTAGCGDLLKWLAMDVVIDTIDGVTMVRIPDGPVLDIHQAAEPSRRSRLHAIVPPNGTRGRLVDAFYSGRNLLHFTFVDCPDGLVTAWHQGDDYNLGYGDIYNYLTSAFRVDSVQEQLDERLTAYEERVYPLRRTVHDAKARLYGGLLRRSRVYSTTTARGDRWSNVDACFATREERDSYIGLSLLVKLHDYRRWGWRDLVADINEYGPRVATSSGSVATMRRLARQRVHCYVNEFSRRRVWPSFGCYL